MTAPLRVLSLNSILPLLSPYFPLIPAKRNPQGKIWLLLQNWQRSDYVEGIRFGLI
jgi:hypothetical protein